MFLACDEQTLLINNQSKRKNRQKTTVKLFGSTTVERSCLSRKFVSPDYLDGRNGESADAETLIGPKWTQRLFVGVLCKPIQKKWRGRRDSNSRPLP